MKILIIHSEGIFYQVYNYNFTSDNKDLEKEL